MRLFASLTENILIVEDLTLADNSKMTLNGIIKNII